MSQKEKSASFSVASRVLGNIPSAEKGPVSDALAALKAAVPAVEDLNPSNIGSDEWSAPASDLFEARDAAGFEVVANTFTGG